MDANRTSSPVEERAANKGFVAILILAMQNRLEIWEGMLGSAGVKSQ